MKGFCSCGAAEVHIASFSHALTKSSLNEHSMNKKIVILKAYRIEERLVFERSFFFFL